MEQTDIYTKIDDLIARHLSHELEDKQSEILQQWIDASPDNRIYFCKKQEIWFASLVAKNTEQYNVQYAFERFRTRTGTLTKQQQKVVKPFRMSAQLYWAAAVVLLLLISYISYWQGGKQIQNQFADVVIESPLGSNTKLYLPDGSLVQLNAGSRITYSQGFGMTDRSVHLSGEGYFEVKKNARIPFLVYTPELKVKVLGTTFNFRNYADDKEAVVSLIEGKVSLSNNLKNDEERYLLPNEKIILNKKSGEMLFTKGKSTSATEWTNGYLFFDEELLPDIAKKLERIYNVEIQIADESLNTYRFYGNFERKEQTIEQVLNMLASTDKIKYTKNERIIVLTLNKQTK